MWLLDHNLPRQVLKVLREFSVSCQAARDRGWQELKNGHLVSAAAEAGFTCILTKDVEFRDAAARALKKYPNMAIVLVVIGQVPGKLYAEAFRKAWMKKPVVPVPGKVAVWP